jgi:signal transduction histidine kinase/CheY-like chemotaxis protein/DNA-binding CsgD family transcriptional regulator
VTPASERARPGARLVRAIALVLNSPEARVSYRDLGFRAFYFQRSKTVMRLSLLLCTLLFLVSAIADLVLRSMSTQVTMNPRLYFFLPVMLAEFLLSLTPWFEEHHQLLLGLAVGLIANIAGLFHYMLPDAGKSVFFYEFNPLILIVLSFTVCRLTFRNANIVSLITLATFEAAELLLRRPASSPAAWSLFVSTNRILISFYAVCSWSCLFLENQLKQEYIDRGKLRELDRLKTDFFSNISHELRTPLTLLIGPVESIRAGGYGAAIDADSPVLESIHKNASRLLLLINRLLDFTQLEAGRMRTRKEATDIPAFVRSIVQSADSAARARKLSLAFFDETHGLVAWIDRSLAEKALLNLLSNAMKFTPEEGSIVVEVATPSESSFTVTVKDTGIGIAEDVLPFIFDRFYQVDSAASRRYPGTGLGLALVKEMVETQGGTIAAKSRPGVGSSFTMSFPIGEVVESAGEAAPRAGEAELAAYFHSDDRPSRSAPLGPSPAAQAESGPKPIVLVVEDNADMRAFIKESLGTGYAYLEAATGTAGLELALARSPDLILTDLMMPGMDGLQLIRELAARDEFRGLPIIVLSARAEESDRLSGIESGALDYLTKPFSARELAAKAKALIQMKRLRDELAERAAVLELGEARFREIAELASAGIAETSADGTIRYLNKTAKTLLGVGEAAPGALCAFAEERDRQRLEAAVQAGLVPDDGRPPIFGFAARDGRRFSAYLKVTSEGGPEGPRRVAFMDFQPVLERALMPGERFFEAHGISGREREVIVEMLRGKSIKETAAALFITEATVKSHQQNIYNKIGIASKRELFELVQEDLLGRYGKESFAFTLISGLLSGKDP